MSAFRRWTTAIATTLVVSGCGSNADKATPVPQSSGTPVATPTPARPVERGPRVLIVGTSLTAGFGLDDPSDAYPAVVQRFADSAGIPVRIINAGLSGETSAGAVRRLEWLLSDSVAVVLIETGANDGLRGLDPDSTEANIHSMVSLVKSRAPRAKVLIAQMEAPANIGPEYTRRFHDLFGAVARKTGATLMPFLLDGVAGDAKLNQSDGIHPNERGAAIVASNVWRELKKHLPK